MKIEQTQSNSGTTSQSVDSGTFLTNSSKIGSARPQFPVTAKKTQVKTENGAQTKVHYTKNDYSKPSFQYERKYPNPPVTVDYTRRSNQYKPESSFSYLGPSKKKEEKQYTAAETKAYFDQVREAIKHHDVSISMKDRKELTHQPSTLTSKEVYNVYTSAYHPRSRSRNRSNPVSRSTSHTNLRANDDTRRKSVYSYSGRVERTDVVLSRREVVRYKAMHSAYNTESAKLKRQETFYNKLENVQSEKKRLQNRLQREREMIRERSKKRQQRQLQRLRDRFYQDTMRRFKTQYVTSRVLEHERVNRKVFGLPDQIDSRKKAVPGDGRRQVVPSDGRRNIASGDSRRNVVLNQGRRNVIPVSQRPKRPHILSQRQSNLKKFGKLFDITSGPSWNPKAKTPKMEGVDVIVVPRKDGKGRLLI